MARVGNGRCAFAIYGALYPHHFAGKHLLRSARRTRDVGRVRFRLCDGDVVMRRGRVAERGRSRDCHGRCAASRWP